MADAVYSPTTETKPKSRCFLIPTELLDQKRFALKVLEVIFSLVAFVQEECINTCISCSALYFFEFVSCTAFFFTALLLVLLSTPLHQKVGVTCWDRLDFIYTAAIFVFFIISSIVFSSNNSDSALEKSAAAFGFLASLLFLLDLVLFYRTHGLPFRRTQENPANGPTSPNSPPGAPRPRNSPRTERRLWGGSARSEEPVFNVLSRF
uniref:MARVEL domain-containing protein n=1 Tax=Neogobius melanostomus TaxID=47308 RepID=A0A8C6SHM6_9GOBI